MYPVTKRLCDHNKSSLGRHRETVRGVLRNVGLGTCLIPVARPHGSSCCSDRGQLVQMARKKLAMSISNDIHFYITELICDAL